MKSQGLCLPCFCLFGSVIVTVALAVPLQSATKIVAVGPPASDKVIRESRERHDMVDENCPKGLRIVQISTNPKTINHHMYPERYMFSPDSRKFLFIRKGVEDSSLSGYWLCDIEDAFSLRQLTSEKRICGLAVSPDGKWAYYMVNAMDSPEAALILKRVSLEDFRRETLLKYDGDIPGRKHKLSSFRGPMSISSDGKRLCGFAFIGDGKTANAPFGIFVFDLETLAVRLVFEGTHFNNMHLQYCRSLDPVLSHDILVQHNHDSVVDASGRTVKLVGGDGADLHVIRDDGTNWRDIPIGRDGTVFHTGHEQWRGRMETVISSVRDRSIGRHRLFESWPIATDDSTSHRGSKIPGAKNNDLTRNAEHTNFDHFSIDLAGMHIVARHARLQRDEHLQLFIGSFSPGENSFLRVRYLLTPKTVTHNWNKPRPFFSPNASMVFFHSDLDGPSHVFMATGYQFPVARENPDGVRNPTKRGPSSVPTK